ncbi:hypothetical protein FOA52_003454 [Chlamydomonas sp. UWO 241]|nr:hypothetical protein FOA52_003454 [Chlamydomonas sp. UWO 241]
MLAENAEIAVNIATAGAIPPLVRLLGPGSPTVVQNNAAGALRYLARSNAEVRTTIAAAGASAGLLQKMKGLGIGV